MKTLFKNKDLKGFEEIQKYKANIRKYCNIVVEENAEVSIYEVLSNLIDDVEK